MRFHFSLLLAACVAFCMRADAQSANAAGTLQLQFLPVINEAPLRIDDTAGEVQITMLRFYISGVTLLYGNDAQWQEPDSYHLLDAEHPESLELKLNAPAGLAYQYVRFHLGIDSATSASGAHGGDLDPANGMYWAWQSGYINFKLEGISPNSTARKHQFHFHLGGYQAPNAALQTITLPAHTAEKIVVKMNLDQLLSGTDFAKQNSIMIPGAEAAAMSQRAAAIFQIQ